MTTAYWICICGICAILGVAYGYWDCYCYFAKALESEHEDELA